MTAEAPLKGRFGGPGRDAALYVFSWAATLTTGVAVSVIGFADAFAAAPYDAPQAAVAMLALWAGVTSFFGLLVWPQAKLRLVRTPKGRGARFWGPLLFGAVMGGACGALTTLALILAVSAGFLWSANDHFLPRPLFDGLGEAVLGIGMFSGFGGVFGAASGLVWALWFVALDLLIRPKPPT